MNAFLTLETDQGFLNFEADLILNLVDDEFLGSVNNKAEEEYEKYQASQVIEEFEELRDRGEYERAD